MLLKDNQYFLKSENNLKEEKLDTIEIDYEKKLKGAKVALELCQTKHAEAKSEAEISQKKV